AVCGGGGDAACGVSGARRRFTTVAARTPTPGPGAALPADLEASLAEAVAQCAMATVVQHGYAHRNHAPAGERSAELGSHRPVDVRLAELTRGRARLARAFDGQFAAVFVPPRERGGLGIAPPPPDARYREPSRFGPRAGALAAPGLAQVNTHVDLIAWRRGRIFIGRDAAIERLAAHLRARRCGDADIDEPTGLLTHHRVTSGETWEFIEELLVRM